MNETEHSTTPGRGANSRWSGQRSLLFLSALLLIVCLTYSSVVHNEYVDYDDYKYVYNSLVLNGLSLDGVRQAFSAPVDANWIPVTLFSQMLEVQLFGSTPVASHLINVFIHGLNSILLWLLLRRLTVAEIRSAVVAAIFALHPLRVESVVWAAERKDVLSASFWLLTMHAYLWYVFRPGWHRYMLVALCLTTGLLAKSMLVTLPVVLLLLDYWPLGRLTFTRKGWQKVLVEKLPLLLPAIVVSLVTLRVQDQGGALNVHNTETIVSNMANAVVSLVVYLRQFFCPTGLTFFYPPAEWVLWQWGGALLLVALISWQVIRQQHRQYLVFGWLWYLVTVLPVIGLIRVGAHAHADRYTYIPLVGITVMVVWLVTDMTEDFPACRRSATVVAALFLLSCTLATYRQIAFWHDSYTLYHRALAVTDNNWLAHNNLAVLQFKQSQLAEAEQHLAAALQSRPEYDDAWANLGHLRKVQRRPQEATEAFRKAVEINPYVPKNLYQLGVNLINNGDLAEGEAVRQRLVALDPNFTAALDQMLTFARSRRK